MLWSLDMLQVVNLTSFSSFGDFVKMRTVHFKKVTIFFTAKVNLTCDVGLFILKFVGANN